MKFTMTCRRILSAILLTSNFAGISRAEAAAPVTLQVKVLNGQGALAHNAHVYIFSRNKKEFLGTRDVNGTAALNLPVGEYRVYAAVTLRANGYIDHFASPEARIHLEAGDPTSLILSLHKAEDSEPEMSPTAWNAPKP